MQMTTEKMFEYASRHQIRFPSTRGELTIEDLWGLPLKSTNKLNLDEIAKAVYTLLKNATDVSFVDTKPKVENTRLEVSMEIIKHIIATKKDEAEAAKRRADNAAERAEYVRILASKNRDKLEQLPEDELVRRIQKLEE